MVIGSHVFIRYHEIALKGRNRPFFVRTLAKNVQRATAALGAGTVHILPGRLALELPSEADWSLVRERLERVFGIANFSRGHTVAPDVGALSDAVLAALRDQRFTSFRVTTKRSFKGFPMNSVEIDRELGGAIQRASGSRVDLEHPELNVNVEVLTDRILFSFEKNAGPGGLPVGTSGRVIALLSGGIDSPVAAQRMMKRGCRVVFVHFHAFPLQDHTTIDKARDLARRLALFQFGSRLLLVPFGPVQQTIVAVCPAPLRVVLYRRFMIRIAERLAERVRAKALVTGESLGQVASQTLDNMRVIDQAASGVILRPLVGMDKEEITTEARRMGTFTISTLPDQDCCQLFVPRSPATAARLEEVVQAERELDIEALVTTATRETTDERFPWPLPIER